MRRAPRKPGAVERIVSIPDDVALSPQTQPPPGGLGQDRSAMREPARELTWARVDQLVTSLSRQIKRSFRPDAVVGVAHGGVFAGGAVASALGAEFFPVRISRRSRDHGGPRSIRLSAEIPPKLRNRRVLVVDDVASSGEALELALVLLSRVRARETRTASLIAREGAYAPDWAALTTSDFIVFPWDYELLDYEPEWLLNPQKAAAPTGKSRKRKRR
ncbi:MAG TPA: phosphoribosyltransferase family protein [Myxococcaceae bacterium]|nr:phosphoribosyltransferase family protein [Myxococcaceae bacterium]